MLRRARSGGLLFTVLALLIMGSLACIPEEEVLSVSTPAPEEVSEERSCEGISGTAFRDQEERDWYTEECSTWPLISIADSPPEHEPEECRELRGRRYESSEERDFFLNECLRANDDRVQDNDNDEDDDEDNGAEDNRRDCDRIRGTDYRSQAERAWYLENCTGAQIASGTDREDCEDIEGTRYRSPDERRWFLTNCTGRQVASGEDRTDCDQIRGSEYRSARERLWYLENCSRTIQPGFQSGGDGFFGNDDD